jgi:hypothetical protein
MNYSAKYYQKFHPTPLQKIERHVMIILLNKKKQGYFKHQIAIGEVVRGRKRHSEKFRKMELWCCRSCLRTLCSKLYALSCYLFPFPPSFSSTFYLYFPLCPLLLHQFRPLPFLWYSLSFFLEGFSCTTL